LTEEKSELMLVLPDKEEETEEDSEEAVVETVEAEVDSEEVVEETHKKMDQWILLTKMQL